MKYRLAITIVQLCGYFCFAQHSGPAWKGTVNGVILSATDLSPVPFATVMVDGTNFGKRADSTGKFQIRIDSGNVLRISHLSYQTRYVKPKYSISPDHIVIILRPDSSDMLAPVVVSPWSNDQFLKVKINDSLNRIARQNVSKEKLEALRYSTATDGSDSYSLQRHSEAKRKSLSNRVPYFSMFDLVTWYNILKSKKKKKK